MGCKPTPIPESTGEEEPGSGAGQRIFPVLLGNAMENGGKTDDVLALLGRRNKELETLVEIGKALTSTLDLKEILSIIMEKLGLLLKPQTWSLLLVDETTG